MNMDDLRTALATRAEGIASKNPELIVRYTIYTDERSEWGVLNILNEYERVIGLEFFESEDSWARPGSVRDYMNAVDEGYPVSVVLPDESYRAFRRMTVDRGGEGFSTYLYSELGIGRTIRAA